MASEWKTVRLGDHVDACLGKMLDKNKNQGTLHPYLGNKQVRWGSFDLDDLSEMRFQDHEHDRYGLKSGDLVVCEGGEPGRCAIWKGEVPDMKIQKALHRIRPNQGLDSTFLHYWFCYAGKFELLDPYFTGTTIKHLTGKAVAELPIPLPPLPEQKAIAHILGSLDDKIELNRRMNETLEGMAQALFKSWFVDFDPVIDNALETGNPIPDEFAARAETRRKALADGKVPDLGTNVSNVRKLFPDSFQTSELGPIPTGWELQPLYDLANFINGAAYKGKVFSESPDALPVIKIAEIKGGITAQTKYTEVNKGDKYKIEDGEILLSWSGNPDTSIDTFIWSNGAGYLNQHIFKVSLHDEADRYFVYYQLNFLRSVFSEIARDKQTTGLGHFTAGDMKRLRVFKPENELLTRFNDAVASLYKRSYENSIATKTLTKLRDTLLPKLISGELRIEDAEKMVGEAGL